jgi:hypothetical protein
MMRIVSLWVAGFLMLASAAAHSFPGWRGMEKELVSVQAPADLIAGLSVGWRWGGVAMAVFGLLVLMCAMRLRRGDTSMIGAVRLIAVLYLAFGVTAVIRLSDPFFLLFVAKGLFAGVPVILPTPAIRG